MSAPRPLRAAAAAAVLVACAGGSLAGQEREITIRTSVSEEVVIVGATVDYEIVIEGEGRETFEISPPAMPSGLVVTGQSQSSSLDIRLPGGVTRVQHLTLSVLARSAGEYRISGPAVRGGGAVVRGDAVTLTVIDGGGFAGPPGAPGPGADDISVRVILTADTVYVGEPVELTTEVLLSDAARRRLRGAPQYFPPTPAGFLIHDLGGGARRFATASDGRRFEVQRFRRAFVPLEAGTFRLPPARVELDLRQSLFDPEFPQFVESDRPGLVVLPLPSDGQPDGFRGAVGRYAVDAAIDPGTTSTGEAVRLEVIVRGRGYVKPLPPPMIAAGDGLDFVSPVEEADVESLNTGLGGEKRFSWIVVPERPGVFELPEVRYPYFDPEAGRYAVARAAPMRLEVRSVPDGPAVASTTLAAPREEPRPGGPLAWVRSATFVASQAAPLVAMALALLALLGGGRRAVSKGELDGRTEDMLRHWAYSDAQTRNATLRRWLVDRLERPDLIGATADDIAAAVGGMVAAPDQARELEELLRSLDATRYGRRRGVALDGDAGRELIRALHAELPRPVAPIDASDARRRRPRRAAVAALLAGLALLATAALTGAGSAADLEQFGAGLGALRGGEPARAAEALEAYVRANPRDPAGWYNLGLAEAGQDDSGRAIWAWLNGIRRAPSDELARANARALGAQESAIVRARGRVPASRAALTLLATLALYLAAVSVLMAARPGAQGRWRVAAGLVGAVAVSAALAGVVRDRARSLAVPLAASELRYEPTRAGEAAQTLIPGTALLMGERRDGWVRVRLPNPGSDRLAEGWIEEAEVAPIGSHAVP